MPTRPWLAVGTAAAALATSITVGATSFAEPVADDAADDTAYVDVTVATLWTEPGIARDVDAPSVANPADPRAWTAGMSLAERRWLVGKLETQVLYGQPVIVDDVDGDWSHVVVPGQPTPRDDRGYPGWLPTAQLAGTAPADEGRFAQVRTATTWAYDDEAMDGEFMELSFNTRLPVQEQTEAAVKVSTPDDGDKWLPAGDVVVYDSANQIPVPTGEDLVADAKLFVDLPYLWAGMSGFGFDCSGLTYNVYRAHGVMIPRDADAQMAAGAPVDADALQAGDLLFYGTPDRIHHVGMYIGDGDMIDARTNTDTAEQTVEIIAVDEHPYRDEFAGAVRFLD